MKEIPGFPGYSVDEQGTVWSSTNWRGKPNRTLSVFADEYGYLKTRLVVDGKRIKKSVHTLVAHAYHGEKPSAAHQVRHLNGVKTDNRPENLAWGTAAENNADKVRLGESSKGSDNGQSKLTEVDASLIKSMLELGASQHYMAALFDIDQAAINAIATGKAWTHVAASRTLLPKLLKVAEAAKLVALEYRRSKTVSMAGLGEALAELEASE